MWIHAVGRFVWEGGTGDEINLVLDGSFGREAMGYLIGEDMLIFFEEGNKQRMGRILCLGRFLA